MSYASSQFFFVLCLIFIASLTFADEVPQSYSVLIRSSCGESTKYEAISHEVILDNRFLSIVGKDRRRYLINLDGKSLEFSRELDVILRNQQDKNQ